MYKIKKKEMEMLFESGYELPCTESESEWDKIIFKHFQKHAKEKETSIHLKIHHRPQTISNLSDA